MPLKKFIKDGISVLSDASRGNYSHVDKAVEDIRIDIFNEASGSFLVDKENLVRDRKAVGTDMRKAYRRLTCAQ